MDKQALIKLLNKDVADEHASIIRYLIHAYQVGEDTPFGSMLLNTAREEMWHTDWLGDAIGELGDGVQDRGRRIAGGVGLRGVHVTLGVDGVVQPPIGDRRQRQ